MHGPANTGSVKYLAIVKVGWGICRWELNTVQACAGPQRTGGCVVVLFNQISADLGSSGGLALAVTAVLLMQVRPLSELKGLCAKYDSHPNIPVPQGSSLNVGTRTHTDETFLSTHK